jgi:hypothetical protein
MRPTTSAEPPAGNGTISFTGRSGQAAEEGIAAARTKNPDSAAIVLVVAVRTSKFLPLLILAVAAAYCASMIRKSGDRFSEKIMLNQNRPIEQERSR